MGKTDISVLAEERAIVATRIFDAPRELVFDVSTKPEHIVRWFGCDQMTMPVCEVDLRPGGRYRYVTRMPDGIEFPLKGEYLEVVRPERIVHTQIYDVAPYSDHVATVTLTFDDEAGKTKLTNRIVFPNDMSFQGAVGSGMAEGMGDAYDRVEAIVAELDSPVFRISRSFNAPRDLVWTVWTDPKHMLNWWGPAHFTSPLCEIDLRPGGKFRFVMRAPDGGDLAVKGQVLEVDPPARLVTLMDHSELPAEWHDRVDPDRPKDGACPALNLRNTVTFEDLGGKTRLTLVVLFGSAAQRDAFLKIGMSEGWNSSLDRFEAELEKSK